MFRLIKLAVLGLLGYAIYEFVRGLSGTEVPQKAASGGNQPRQRRQEQPHLGAGNMQFSGPGEGQRVKTEDATGSSTPHYVGRGVVSR